MLPPQDPAKVDCPDADTAPLSEGPLVLPPGQDYDVLADAEEEDDDDD